MPDSYDLILKGGTVVNQDGEGLRDIGIRGGRFAAVDDLRRASAGEIIDCRGLHLFPGGIDTQVHFREPGLTHKEDLESGSLLAGGGGVPRAVGDAKYRSTYGKRRSSGRQSKAWPSPHALRLRVLCWCDSRQHHASRRA